MAGIAAGAAAFPGGGFGETERAVFAALAGLALLVALARDPLPRAARSLPALALGGLALLAAASALWTIGEPVDALRWGLVVAGYLALFLVAAGAAERTGTARGVAAVIVAIAAAEAAVALAGFALREKPLALHVGGEWQAAGSFEYGPALALVELSALPALLTATLAGRRWASVVAAAGASAAVLAVGVAGSRLALAALAAIVVIAIAAPGATVRTARTRAVAACAIVAGVPALFLVIADPADPASALGTDAARAIAIVAVIAIATVAWAVAVRFVPSPEARAPGHGRPARAGHAAVALGLVAVAFAVALAASAETERSGHGVEPSGGALHGRTDHWSAAIETFAERPLAGAGAEAFLVASADDQGANPVLYAHSLPLETAAELGVAGLALVVILYAGSGLELWRARASQAAWLLGPAVALFALSNLVDWTWHLAGCGAIFALALGGLAGSNLAGWSGDR